MSGARESIKKRIVPVIGILYLIFSKGEEREDHT
jgi:hypothetical protein